MFKKILYWLGWYFHNPYSNYWFFHAIAMIISILIFPLPFILDELFLYSKLLIAGKILLCLSLLLVFLFAIYAFKIFPKKLRDIRNPLIAIKKAEEIKEHFLPTQVEHKILNVLIAEKNQSSKELIRWIINYRKLKRKKGDLKRLKTKTDSYNNLLKEIEKKQKEIPGKILKLTEEKIKLERKLTTL